ncbi:MAG: glutamate--tRNA ligase [Betaproteobacteria bacterium]|nr:glutamate--tRNA ligase [Pseudomonadota bacterium]NBO04223.1 glutamate--tRNA ligase [Betaproteobacteria bacterium]NBP34161.1 glutamate--tRNA ligase [Betaproteobacteria bacterium]NBQ77969.1 glutamate--tRNA ligase [Betaproteobacteria bacterium]NBS38615.1 glutamate--tRNA ligase [Betaproteobacteria bacterium]
MPLNAVNLNQGSSVRTRFAPSPTGFLHIGGARTALFAWAFARHHEGRFVLRIEDTDLERSTPEATQAIIDGMAWLNLQADEGPFFQTKRMDRYREVIAQMLAQGSAYHCWASPEELDAMREAQRAQGLKPRYDGRWRPEQGAGKSPPDGVSPVVRFRNADDGYVVWHDMVKGTISIANSELDDLIIARSDGTPTYNFCVVVDDLDMQISHVIRGDDHVNNTPRQINILRALGGKEPIYGHLPMIHGPDGQKLSKRHGAVSVIEFDLQGFMPDAVVNYLARLGWSHGDDELFSREDFIAWFDGSALSQSPAQLDYDKLRWVNQHYVKQADGAYLLAELKRRLALRSIDAAWFNDRAALALIMLVKDRVNTLEELADWACSLMIEPDLKDPVIVEGLAQALQSEAIPALKACLTKLRQMGHLPDEALGWTVAEIAMEIKGLISSHGIKMPQLAIPLRWWCFGRGQTPAVDAMLSILPHSIIASRLERGLASCGETL